MRFRRRIVISELAKRGARTLGLRIVRSRSKVVLGLSIGLRSGSLTRIISQIYPRTHPTRVPFEKTWSCNTWCITFSFEEEQD